MKLKKCKIKALKAKKDKPQHMVEDEVYEVTEEMAKILIEGKKAVRVDQDTPLGKLFKKGKDLLS